MYQQYRGGPSEKLGIQSGDRIIKVENENVASIGITNEDVIGLLRGEKGSVVNIIIKENQKNKHLPFKIIRDDIISNDDIHDHFTFQY